MGMLELGLSALCPAGRQREGAELQLVLPSLAKSTGKALGLLRNRGSPFCLDLLSQCLCRALLQAAVGIGPVPRGLLGTPKHCWEPHKTANARSAFKGERFLNIDLFLFRVYSLRTLNFWGQ